MSSPDDSHKGEPDRPSGLSEDAVREVLEEQIRPALQRDGGDIELVSVEGNDVHVRLQGACRGCPSATITLQMGVESVLRDEFPELGSLVAE